MGDIEDNDGTFGLNYPQDGYLHTFLIGGLLGIVWAIIAHRFRNLIGKFMNLFKFFHNMLECPTFVV